MICKTRITRQIMGMILRERKPYRPVIALKNCREGVSKLWPRETGHIGTGLLPDWGDKTESQRRSRLIEFTGKSTWKKGVAQTEYTRNVQKFLSSIQLRTEQQRSKETTQCQEEQSQRRTANNAWQRRTCICLSPIRMENNTHKALKWIQKESGFRCGKWLFPMINMSPVFSNKL